MKLLGVAVLALAVVAGVTGCASAEESAPAPSPSSATPSPSAAKTLPSTIPAAASAGSDGLTVRYRGADGSVKTVRVEDFPR